MWDVLKNHLVEPVKIIVVAVVLAITALIVERGALTVPQGVLFGIVFLLLTILVLLVVSLSEAVLRLRSIAPRLDYYDAYRAPHGADAVWEEATGHIKEAKEEIIAVNWFAEEQPKQGDRVSDARTRYFKE